MNCLERNFETAIDPPPVSVWGPTNRESAQNGTRNGNRFLPRQESRVDQ